MSERHDCTDFRNRLDAGGVDPDVAVACVECAALLRAEHALALLWAARPAAGATATTTIATSDATFVARVLERVAVTPQRTPLDVVLPVVDLVPWWIRALMRREAILTGALATAVAIAAPTLAAIAPSVSEFGASASRAILLALAPLVAPLAHAAGTNPLVGTGLLLGLAPLVALLSWGGYRLGVAVGGARLSPVERAAVGVRA